MTQQPHNLLTKNQLNCYRETKMHIGRVRHHIAICVEDLRNRMARHDASKLTSPELEQFTAIQAKLSNVVYGSPEYDDAKKMLGPALEHHYAHNDHHPEHFNNGIDGMNLLQVLEMFCDWWAASERMKDGGDIRKSIAINTERFNLSPQLVQILLNTVDYLESKTE